MGLCGMEGELTSPAIESGPGTVPDELGALPFPVHFSISSMGEFENIEEASELSILEAASRKSPSVENNWITRTYLELKRARVSNIHLCSGFPSGKIVVRHVEALGIKSLSSIYSYNLARLSRSVQDLRALIDLADTHGAAVRLVADHVDTSTATGRMLLTSLAAVDEMTADLASEHARDAVAARRARGDRIGHPHYGEREGEELLESSIYAINYFNFLADAIDVCLRVNDWDSALRYAGAFETYVADEPTAWSDFHIRRGRALTAFGRGECNSEIIAELTNLRETAAAIGLNRARLAIDAALAAGGGKN